MRRSVLKFARPLEIELAKAGPLELRLARSPDEVAAAQRLRYDVFYEEMAARADTATRLSWRDSDVFDTVCDHLIVIDHAAEDGPEIVGTYRLIDAAAASAAGGFYSSGEYDLSALLALRRPDGSPARLLELGRSCVAPAYRHSAAIMLLWRGIAAYLDRSKTDFMFGCASFPGTDPDAFAAELTLLDWRHRSPIGVQALPEVHQTMSRMPRTVVDERKAWRNLPPLVRGYLQAGAAVGDGAYIDHQFGTVDIFMIIATDNIRARYRERFTS